MPKLPKRKDAITLKQAKRLGGENPRTVKGPKPETVEGVPDFSELYEAVTDLLFEMRNLNSNIGKLYDELKKKRGIEREIPEDDIPF